MKNLLIIVPVLGTGGQERIAALTCEVLKEVYNVYLVVFERTDNEFHVDVPIICLNSPASNSPICKAVQVLKRNYMLRKLKKKLKIDISYSLGEPADISNILSRYKEKVIVSIHGYTSIPTTSLTKRIYGFIFNKADVAVCVSNAISDEFARALKISPNKVKTLYNPIDVELIKKMSVEGLALSGSPKIIVVGRLVKIKNFEMAIRAISNMKEKYPDVHLYVVGDGDNREALEHLISHLRLENHVSLVGNQSNPFKYISNADVLLCTSFNEGFGNTIVEAMACGIPVVSVDCKAGPREILSPDSSLNSVADDIEFAKYGVLIPPSFVEDDPIQVQRAARVLSNAIDSLLSNPRLFSDYKKSVWHEAKNSVKVYISQILLGYLKTIDKLGCYEDFVIHRISRKKVERKHQNCLRGC